MHSIKTPTVSAVALGDASASSFNHRYPDPNTVHGQTLGAFLRGEQLTTLEARPRLHTTTITQAVQKLRGAGWPVVTERITVPTADGDRQANIGRYSLLPETIIDAGETGQRYAAECAQIKAERRAA